MMDTQTLPPLPEARIESYQIDGTMRRTTLHTYSGQDMRDYALAAIALASPAAPAQAVPPFAWATHHAPPMIFLTQKEAAAYCDDDEQPIPLYEAPVAQTVELAAALEQQRALLAAPPAVQPLRNLTEDAQRWRFITEDHADASMRNRVAELWERLPVMGYSTASAAVDALRGLTLATQQTGKETP